MIVTPDSNPSKVSIPILPLPKQNISDDDIRYHMEPFYQANPWTYEVDKLEHLEIGLSPAEVDPVLSNSANEIDKNCAKIVYTTMVQEKTLLKSPKNPFLLQNKMYPLRNCYKEITLSKLESASAGQEASRLQEKLKKLELERWFCEEGLLELYLKIMEFATQDIPRTESVVPLPAVIYFLVSLVFKTLKFSIHQRIFLFSQLIKLLVQYGWDSLDPARIQEDK